MSGNAFSDLTAATELTSSDLFAITQANASKKVTGAIMGLGHGSKFGWQPCDTDYFAAAPPWRNYDISGDSFDASDISDWSAGAHSLGDFVKPTTPNGYIYECTTAGTDTTEPTWATTIGDEQTHETVGWTCHGLHCITTTSGAESELVPGRPIKYTYNGADYYGIIFATNGSTFKAIAGAPLLRGDDTTNDLTAIKYGPASKIKVVDFPIISGNYGDGVADLLSSDLGTGMIWGGSTAYLVAFRAMHKSGDSGANEAYINIKVAGSLVSRANGNLGIQPGTSWVHNPLTDINTSNYAIAFNEAIEIRCTQAGSNGDAEDLTVQAIFVEV